MAAPGPSLRTVLIAHAAAAIDEHGAAAVSLRDVARRAGVSHAAPAHHFRDKTGLLTATAAATFDRFADHLTARMTATTGGLDRLVAAGVAYVEFATAHWRRFEFIFRRDLIDAGDPDYVRAGSACLGLLVTAVTSAQADEWAPHHAADDLVHLCWATVHGLASLSASGALLNHRAADHRVTADHAAGDGAPRGTPTTSDLTPPSDSTTQDADATSDSTTRDADASSDSTTRDADTAGGDLTAGDVTTSAGSVERLIRIQLAGIGTAGWA